MLLQTFQQTVSCLSDCTSNPSIDGSHSQPPHSYASTVSLDGSTKKAEIVIAFTNILDIGFHPIEYHESIHHLHILPSI